MLTYDDRLELVVRLASSMVAGTGAQAIDTRTIARKAWRLLEEIEHHSESEAYQPERMEKPKERQSRNFASSAMYRR